jgi:hypothetical protein
LFLYFQPSTATSHAVTGLGKLGTVNVTSAGVITGVGSGASLHIAYIQSLPMNDNTSQ